MTIHHSPDMALPLSDSGEAARAYPVSDSVGESPRRDFLESLDSNSRVFSFDDYAVWCGIAPPVGQRLINEIRPCCAGVRQEIKPGYIVLTPVSPRQYFSW